MRVQPFPFGALPALTRADLGARAALRSRVPALSLAQLAEVAGRVLNTPITLRARETRARPAMIGTPGDVGILLRTVGADLERAVLLELEGALTATAVAAALRGRAPVVYDTTQVPSPRVIGAAAAVVLAILRRVSTEPIEVLAAGPAHVLAADLHRRAGGLCTWQAAASLDSTQYSLRITCLPSVLEQAEPPARSFRDTSLPLSVPVVLTRLVLAERAFAEIEVGDALMLADLDPSATTRQVWLATPGGEHAVQAILDGGNIVYGGEADPLPWAEESLPASSPNEDNEMSEGFQETLGDVPVVVRVEVGSVQVAAKRWGELMSGDTLTLGTRVGAPVTLRVAGVEVAHGELVQVEGELGVRILKRLDLPGEPTVPGSLR